MSSFFGRSTITGLARLDGWPVAVLAGDPYHYGGGWTADAAQKVVRFVDLAETFQLPVVHLVDNPGFVIGTESEKQATIRHGARALTAIYQASVPWCSILIRKLLGWRVQPILLLTDSNIVMRGHQVTGGPFLLKAGLKPLMERS